jgi:Flp pilus assembly protein TadB
MPPEIPDDPRRLWQKQPTEEFRMSENELRRRTESRRERARQRALLSMVFGLVLAVLFGFAAARPAPPVTRAGWILVSLWSLYFAYHVRRWQWPRDPVPPDASLQYYRRELEQRMDYSRHLWVRTALPVCFLGLALVLVPPLAGVLKRPGILLNAAPVLVLLAVWAVLFRRQRRMDRQRLQRELAEIEALER